MLMALLAALARQGFGGQQGVMGRPAAGPAAMPPAQGGLGGEGEYGGDEYAHAGWGQAQPYDYGQPPGKVPPTGAYINRMRPAAPMRRGMGDFAPPPVPFQQALQAGRAFRPGY
jgi:hypothetical protein